MGIVLKLSSLNFDVDASSLAGEPEKLEAIPDAEKSHCSLEAKRWFEEGKAHWEEARLEQARTVLVSALHLYSRLEDEAGRANVLGMLGNVAADEGFTDEALEWYKQALALYRIREDSLGEARMTVNVGVVLDTLGDYDRAIDLYESAHTVFEHHGDETKIALSWMNIGVAYAKRGAPERSETQPSSAQTADLIRGETSLRQALAVFERLGATQEQIKCHANLGSTLLHRRLPECAVEVFRRALRLCDEIGSPQRRIALEMNLGDAYTQLGDPRRGLPHLEEARRLCLEMNLKEPLYHAELYLSFAHEALGDAPLALRHHRLYHELERDVQTAKARTDAEALAARAEAERTRRETELLRAHSAELERVNALLRQADAERQALFEQLAVRAERDNLTGLPNRDAYRRRLLEILHEARTNGYRAALLGVRLKRLRQVNERFGRVLGDRLLIAVAQALNSVAPTNVFRLEGGEFAVILPQLQQANQALETLRVLQGALSRPFDAYGRVLSLSASLGCAVFPDDGADEDTLQRRAFHPDAVTLEPAVPSNPSTALASADGFTPREREVLRLVAEGLSNKCVAQRLGVAERTVRFHVTSVLAKLEVKTRAQAVAVASKRGWL
jgi:diguanylate cyclase (GGDEF)-like protein